MPINAAHEFQTKILDRCQSLAGLRAALDAPTVSGKMTRLHEDFSPEHQFGFDCALWYGYLATPGATRWKQELVKKIFCTLEHANLMYWVGPEENDWRPWSDLGVPVASAISHTARVLVQCPDDQYWTWLWDGSDGPQTRGAATHGIELARTPSAITCGRRTLNKLLKENKNGGTSGQYGTNVGLGGVANVHPISNKTISENGKHGHLYFRYQALGRVNGLLIALEQSAPIDRYEPTGSHGISSKIAYGFSLLGGQGIPDQYGGYHGLGGHNRYAATGGDDWAGGSDNARKKIGQLGGLGPQRYIDSMFIELDADKFSHVRAAYQNYNIGNLASPGLPPR